MVNGAFNLRFCSRDFGFERGDAGVKLVDRERIEVLPRQRGQRIARSGPEDLVQIHDPKR